MRHTVSRCLGLGVAVLAAAVLSAQSGTTKPSGGQPQPPQQPTFRTGTNFVRVDVFPTRAGQPVQGLAAEDFEVFEDGVRQTIDTFEHVLITPAGPQASRREPTSQRESLQAAADPRARVFVIFLDTPNVTVQGSHQIKEPLIRLLDSILGPDDLAAIMTPEMSAANLTLARKTVVIEQQLRDHWTWGTRHSITEKDDREEAYENCYPPLPGEQGFESALARELIARKRERATLEALQDLVRWLHGVRDERKAIITITEGWLLYRPNHELTKLRQSGDYQEPIPGPEVIGVDPNNGKLTTRPRGNFEDRMSKRECDTDRMRLAMLDNEQFFRDIVQEANWANASFYPVDPRGLAVWDSPLGPAPPPPMLVDRANLRDRLESLHDLALSTDGLAVVQSNDLDQGLRRIADDLTSYYLLGYYSTNTKLDGKFRRLEVKVRQPGIDVRARRGYRAPTAEEVALARAEAPAAPAPTAFTAAMGTLGRIRPDAPFRVNAAAHSGAAGETMVWVAGELLRLPGADTSGQGGTADIEVRAGNASNTARVKLEPGQRTFMTAVTLAEAQGAEKVTVRARLTAEGAVVPVTDTVDARVGAQPLLFRRGPSTGNQVVPAADFRFRRTERLRLDLPVAGGTTAVSARLLDGAGQPLQVPVAVGTRTDDGAGQQWITATLILAPLAAGDYAIELTTSAGAETRQTIAAFRVTR